MYYKLDIDPLKRKTNLNWAILEKTNKQGVEDMGFPGESKKCHTRFPGINCN